MRSAEFETFAKINLTLDVSGKRPDGYHDLVTVMQSISLSDHVTVEVRDEPGIQLVCSAPFIPTDSRNTAWRAAQRFLEAANLDKGLSIVIDKRIPIAAGLAGGSSDAAGVLSALDWLFPDRIAREALFAIAAGVGADVPFCLAGGTILCTGIGDVLTPQPSLAGWPLVLIKAPFGLSTPEVFRRFNLDHVVQRPDHEAFLLALGRQDWPAMAATCGNVLESVAFAMHPQLRAIRDRLAEAGALIARMSGSGPTLFGVFADAQTRDEAFDALASLTASGFSRYKAETEASGPRYLSSYEVPVLPDFSELTEL